VVPFRSDNLGWSRGPPLPEPRAGGGLAVSQGRLHFFGGYTSDRDTVAADHWSLPLRGDGSWTREADMPTPRAHLAAATLEGSIYALGGANDHDPRDVLPQRLRAKRRAIAGTSFSNATPSEPVQSVRPLFSDGTASRMKARSSAFLTIRFSGRSPYLLLTKPCAARTTAHTCSSPSALLRADTGTSSTS